MIIITSNSTQRQALEAIASLSSGALAERALGIENDFAQFMAKTTQDLLKQGMNFLRFKKTLHKRLGKKEGNRVFKDWIEEIGSLLPNLSGNIAQISINIAEFYHQLPRHLKKLLLDKTRSWSPSALNELRKVPQEHLVYLIQAGQQTVLSIRAFIASLQPKKYLVMGETATDVHWELVAKKLKLDEEALASLKQQAQYIAAARDSEALILLTDDIIEAVAQAGYNTEQLLKPAKKASASELEAFSRIEELEKQIEQYQRQRDEAIAQKELEIAQYKQEKTEAIAQKELEIAQYKQEKTQLEKELAEYKEASQKSNEVQARLSKLTTELSQKDEMLARYSSEALVTIQQYKEQTESLFLQNQNLLKRIKELENLTNAPFRSDMEAKTEYYETELEEKTAEQTTPVILKVEGLASEVKLDPNNLSALSLQISEAISAVKEQLKREYEEKLTALKQELYGFQEKPNLMTISEEETVTDSEEETVTDSEEETVIDSEEKTVIDSEEKTVIDSEEETVTDFEIQDNPLTIDTMPRATQFIKGAKVAIVNVASEVLKFGKMVKKTGDKIIVALIDGGHERVFLNQLVIIKDEKPSKKRRKTAKGFGELIGNYA